MRKGRLLLLGAALTALLGLLWSETWAATSVRWTAWGNVRRVENLYKKIISYFEEKHPDIKITYEPYPETEKILAMFAAGTAPDVILADWNIAQTYGGAGRALALDGLIARDKLDTAKVYGVALDGYRTDGKLYAMPFKIDTHAIFYNKKLFDEAGTKYPTDDWKWNDILTNAQKLTKQDKGQFGFAWYESGYDAYSAWPWMNRGRMIVKDEKGQLKYTFSDPNTVEAFQFLYDLIHKHKVMLSPSEATASAMGMGGEQMFMTGKIGFHMSGDWHLNAFVQIKDFDWDIAMLPYQKARATELGGIGNLINSGSKVKDQAWEYLKFLLSERAQTRLLETFEGLPAIKGMPAPNVPGKNTRALVDAAQYMMFEPHFVEWPQVNEEIELPLLDQLWIGKKTAKEVASEIDAKANAFLSKLKK
jgi:multiple sugar transport system substrate-binding protein